MILIERVIIDALGCKWENRSLWFLADLVWVLPVTTRAGRTACASSMGMPAERRCARVDSMPPRSVFDCQASIVPNRGRQWDGGMELYFKVPDWWPNVLVQAAVGRGITGIDRCWHIREGSQPTLDIHGMLSFELGPSGSATDADIVGCILNGHLEVDDTRDVAITYHGPHCYALPPPPPAGYEECPPSWKFEIESSWGATGGWTARVLLHLADWAPNRAVRLVFPSDEPEDGDEGVKTAILGTNLRVQEAYNAKLLGSSRLSPLTLRSARRVPRAAA